MRILHIELAGFFNEGMSYQTNMLVRANILDGHQVEVISSNYEWRNGIITKVDVGEKVVAEGARLIRIPYVLSFKHFTFHKIRAVAGLYSLINEFHPNVILSHDLCYLSSLDLVKYKKKHPLVKIYADTHTADYNSGKNWISLNILHRKFYKLLIQKISPYLEKYFYVSESERLFSIYNYRVQEEIMEYYPLGGYLYNNEEYWRIRNKRRLELGVSEHSHLYVHSGKMTKEKRTLELLKAYTSVDDNNSRLVVIGSFSEEIGQKASDLINNDDRIFYIGWKNGDELREYLCACDMYCQPGSVSATMQNAICCSCAIMSYPHLSYTNDLDWGNIFWVKTVDDMKNTFLSIKETPKQLLQAKEKSLKCAKELLDYRKLAKRLYI